MFKTLIATALLSFSTCSNTLYRSMPLKATQRVSGSYNFKNEYTLESFNQIEQYFLDTYGSSTFDETIVLEETSFGENCVNPLYISSYPYEMCYISSINFRGDFEYGSIDMYISYYRLNDEYSHYYQEIISYNSLNNIEDFTFADMYFMVRSDSVIIHDKALDLFNFVFTQEDNIFVKTVNGYYTMYNTVNRIDRIDFLGNIIVGNNLYYGCYCESATQNIQFKWLSYNGYDSAYVVTNYSISAWQRLWYFNNTKMTYSSYQLLSVNYGVFDYVQDTSYNNATFEDLFFGVVDTPIYALTSLLSFELFGVNLFNALASIVTLMLVVIVIRKLL